MGEWRDTIEKAGYQVSDTGQVRSFINNRHGVGTKSHPLKQQINKNGYPTVCLGRGNRHLVNRLVASAFIPNPNNYPLVLHSDDNPLNNNVKNLRWGTQKHNMEDCVNRGRLVGNTKPAIEAKRRPVRAYRKNGDYVGEFESSNEAARQLDLWPQHISSVLKGKISQTGGYRFEYVNKDGVKNGNY